MAIGHYTRETVTVILRSDDALDPECDYDEYALAGYDESKLAFVEGKTPTRLHLRRLTYDARERVKEMQLSGQTVEAVNLAFRAGVDKVEGYVRHGEGDREISLPSITHEDGKALGSLVPIKWVADSGIPFDVRYAIALVVQSLSEGQVPFVKGSSTPPSD